MSTTAFALSQYAMPKLVDAEFLYTLLGDEFGKPGKTKVTLSLFQDFADVLKTDAGVPYLDMVTSYLKSIVPGYKATHPVNMNLGFIVCSEDGTYQYWASGLYLIDGVPTIQIGGSDKDVEPVEIPLVFDTNLSRYLIPGLPAHITQAWAVVSNDIGNNKLKYGFNFSVTNPKGSPIRDFSIWCRVEKNAADPYNEQVCDQLRSAVFDDKIPLEGLLAGVPTGGYVLCKPNQIFSHYYATHTFKQFAFKVVGLELVTHQTKDGGSFSPLEVTIDSSDLPAATVIAVEFGSKDGRPVPLNTVQVLQFDSGRSDSPSQLMSKYTDASEKGTLPSVENPWIIQFVAPPKKPNNTPPYAVWTSAARPAGVTALLEAVKSPGYFGPESNSVVSMQMRAAIDVAALSESEFDDDDL